VPLDALTRYSKAAGENGPPCTPDTCIPLSGVTTNEGGDGLTDPWAAALDVSNCVATATNNVAQPNFSNLSV
jgi:hypothetical protein